jgi:hypothetical protein
MRIDPCDLGVVVEHLLEVGHQPLGIGRIAVEPATELVPDPAVGHRVERSSGDRQRTAVACRHGPPQEELDRHRLGKLRCGAPAAVMRVERTLDRGDRRFEQGRRRVAGHGGHPVLRRERLDQPLPRTLYVRTLLAPRAVDAFEHLQERRHPVPRLIREVRSTVERLPIRRQEDRHRPAATAGHRLDRCHIDLVEVGPLFPVDLDRHEAAVEERRRRLVLEGLALHHVAPVAGRVADAEEDRPVQQLGAGERIRTPREPVHGIIGVLEEIGTRLSGEAVGHQGDGTRDPPSAPPSRGVGHSASVGRFVNAWPCCRRQ